MFSPHCENRGGEYETTEDAERELIVKEQKLKIIKSLYVPDQRSLFVGSEITKKYLRALRFEVFDGESECLANFDTTLVSLKSSICPIWTVRRVPLIKALDRD